MTPHTTKIIRYSTKGFKPQYQSHHLKHIDYHINNFNINDFPEHLRYIIQKQHEKHLSFYKEHYQNFQYGIWFFINGHKNNQSLNHLKHKVPCWEAEIENDVLLYDVNWEYQITLSDQFGINSGFYLPASQTHKIHNIKNENLIRHRKMSYFYLHLYKFQSAKFTLIKKSHLLSHQKENILLAAIIPINPFISTGNKQCLLN